MKQYIFCVLATLLLIGCQSNENKTKTNTHQHGHKGPSSESKKAGNKVNYDCRHCGMPSQDFPKWKAKVVADAGEVWYCSPRCMFINTLNEAKAPKGIQAIQVISYYDTQAIDAKTAFYVTESDVLGPMGHDLVPLKDKKAAEDFKAEHQGKNIFAFAEVDMKTIKALVNKQ